MIDALGKERARNMRRKVYLDTICRKLRSTSCAKLLADMVADEPSCLGDPPHSGPFGPSPWCAWCQRPMETPHADSLDMMDHRRRQCERTRDHIVPRSALQPGTPGLGNFIDCCRECNNAKANTHLLVFLLHRPLAWRTDDPVREMTVSRYVRSHRGRRRKFSERPDLPSVQTSDDALVWMRTGITPQRLQQIGAWLKSDAKRTWVEEFRTLRTGLAFDLWLSSVFTRVAENKMAAPWLAILIQALDRPSEL